MNKPIIGITTGDLNGIGLELIIKTFSDNRMLDLCTPVVFASNKSINYYRKILPDYPLVFASTKDLNTLNTKQFNVFNCWEDEVAIQPGVLNDLGGKYALRSLMVATQCLKDKQIDLLVTAPLNKANTHSNDFPFTGHTPFLKDKFGAKEVLMLLFCDHLRVGLVTEHLPVSKLGNAINKDLLISKINILHETLIKDFGIDAPKIAVLGLNPHAGDQGEIGNEEMTIIKPFIEQQQQMGRLVYGPFSPDSFFAKANYKQFDAVLAMYHDQGLIPFKMLDNGAGVNFTAGLSIIRTSPDHGTAFDIAGKGIADENSFRESIYKAIDLFNQRMEYASQTANPLKKSNSEREKMNG